MPSPDQRPSAFFLALALLALGVGCGESAPPPSLVLIVLDTTRADALSCYGNPLPTTPRLDELAAQGALFESAFATDSWTLPSHASLLTGLYPSQHSATSETNHLDDRAVALAEVLAGRGYATGAFVANPWVSIARGFGQGFEHFSEAWRRPPGTSYHLDDPTAVANAEAWIDAQLKQGRPFFAFLNLNIAHLPYDPDPVIDARLHPTPRSLERQARLRKIAGMWSFLGGAVSLDTVDFGILRELYHAEVAMADALVGRLVDHLATAGVLDDVVLVVTSDHGENLGDHGSIDHLLSLYDSTLRVPLLIRYPAAIHPGERRPELVSLVDVFPTVLALLGQADDEQAKRSLFRSDRTPTEYVVAENERPLSGIELMRRDFPDFDVSSIDERTRRVRTRDHALIWREHHEAALYDLAADPGEEHDIAALQPEVRDRLLELLARWKQAVGEPARTGAARPDDDETLGRLRALGYVE